MIRWFRVEWRRTSKGGQRFLMVWVGIMVAIGIACMGYCLVKKDYSGTVEALCGLLFIVFLKAIVPFLFAAGARKRGGSFATWMTTTILISPWIMLFFYFIGRGSKSVLPEYEEPTKGEINDTSPEPAIPQA